jgi:hypothetical protein
MGMLIQVLRRRRRDVVFTTRPARPGCRPLAAPGSQGPGLRQEAQKRTLTNLYSERPTWLDLAHKKLDAAVVAAFGWPAELAEEEILARLLKLNLERAEL